MIRAQISYTIINALLSMTLYMSSLPLQILQNHIVSSAVLSASAAVKAISSTPSRIVKLPAMLPGSTLSFTMASNKGIVILSGSAAGVFKADIKAGASIIHVIDNVLIPDAYEVLGNVPQPEPGTRASVPSPEGTLANATLVKVTCDCWTFNYDPTASAPSTRGFTYKLCDSSLTTNFRKCCEAGMPKLAYPESGPFCASFMSTNQTNDSILASSGPVKVVKGTRASGPAKVDPLVKVTCNCQTFNPYSHFFSFKLCGSESNFNRCCEADMDKLGYPSSGPYCSAFKSLNQTM